MSSILGGDFCLVCGSEPPLFTDRLCEVCCRKRTKLAIVPTNVPWVRCARCGIVELEGKWTDITYDQLWNELLQRHVQVHHLAEQTSVAMDVEPVSDRHTLLHIQVEGIIDSLLYQEEYTMRARMANGVCITCTRKAGNYFEATVQLRSSARKLDEEEFRALRDTFDDVLDSMPEDPMFFITKEGPVQGGYDVILGSKGLARTWGRHLISEYGGHVIETNSVVGKKDGVDVTRLTLLYRKPGYDLGDVISFRNALWRPTSWSKDGAIIQRVTHHEKTGVTWRDLESANVAARRKDILEVELLTEDDSVGEFLDPTNWKMSSVRLPYTYEQQSKILLCKVEGEWIAVPRLGIDEKIKYGSD